MTAPRLSVVLCNYNHESVLARALTALLAQTYPAHEIIVVDDGSTDESVGVVEGLMKRHPNLRLLRNKSNRGVVYSGNLGLAAVTGDYVGWYAADDLAFPRLFERIAEAARAHPQAGVIAAEPVIEPIGDRAAARAYRYDLGAGVAAFDGSAFVRRQRDRYLWLCSAALMLRVDALRAHGGWSAEMDWLADWVAVYALAIRHGAVCIEEPLAMLQEDARSFGRLAAAEPGRRDRAIGLLLDWLRDRENRDLRRAFRDAPLMLRYALGERLFPILARRPADADLLAAATWAWARHRLSFALAARS